MSQIHSPLAEKLPIILGGLGRACDGVIIQGNWPQAPDLQAAITQIQQGFERDYTMLCSQAACLVSAHGDIEDLTDQVINLFRSWQSCGEAPSLVSLCVFALDHMQIKPQADVLNMLLMSAILGEIENTLPYHGNIHYKKILAQLMRMIVVHNDIYNGTKRAFTETQICLLMAAACIHDLGHDGLGNVIKGTHIDGRLERLAFDIAKPYLTVAGADETLLAPLKVMLLTTDVSPLGDPTNPAGQMKAAYRYHFLGEHSRTHALNLSDDLAVLEKDPSLTTMCLILHEADLAPSAGLTYAMTQYETALFRAEIVGDAGKPSHVVDFLDQICGRRMLSDAGQKLFATNMARIYALAEQDMKDGDEGFPKPELTGFMLGVQSETASGKTIN